MVISPTPGRVVWYYPTPWPASQQNSDPLVFNTDQPFAAIVASVRSDRLVNLMVIDPNGNPHARASITLMQDGDAVPATPYCAWMPYQKGQAAKHEAATAALAK